VRFLLDESVTGQVYRLLNEKGYEVQRSIDLIGQGQPDRDVAELANTIECILIDSNCTDFRRLNPRVPPDGGIP
jgi:predicted nuclease of predicted toxin-antitoxin system